MFTSTNDFNLTTLFIHKKIVSLSDVVCEAACLLNLYVFEFYSSILMNGILLLNEIESLVGRRETQIAFVDSQLIKTLHIGCGKEQF